MSRTGMVLCTLAVFLAVYAGFIAGLGEGFKMGKDAAIQEIERQAAAR